MQGYCWTMRELIVRLGGFFLRIRELQNGTTVHAYFNLVGQWTMRELIVRLGGFFLRIKELQNGTTVYAYFNLVDEFVFFFFNRISFFRVY